MGVLEGKVVLVTGGANGIGKECALLAAREGAKVVVNDLGGGAAGGDAGSAGPAETVAAEIRNTGGEAVSNSDSISSRAGVARMIEQAMDTYKGLHSIVSPAGILRDKMFHKMSDAEWDIVIDVHLNGSYNVTHAAINHFREQEEGSFVLFSSTSGLIGNVGQANYAAAKMGIVGLSRIIAMEGAQRNVRSNVIAPFAWSRLIATIPIKDEASAKRVERMKNFMRADQVAQLAVSLASPACKDVSGQIFVARGNEIFLMSQPRPIRGMGKVEGWTPETIANHCMPAMKPSFTELGATTSVFGWDPV
jgi:NAD(P)-dependent dehydrogenase (short-subunit alcohol dehydrogenase family)